MAERQQNRIVIGLGIAVLLITVLSGCRTGHINTVPDPDTTNRDLSVRDQFRRLTGYPHGRPGYVVDHIVPLCAGGADAVYNMQWQTVEDAKVKDRDERKMCAEIRKAEHHKWKEPKTKTRKRKPKSQSWLQHLDTGIDSQSICMIQS